MNEIFGNQKLNGSMTGMVNKDFKNIIHLKLFALHQASATLDPLLMIVCLNLNLEHNDSFNFHTFEHALTLFLTKL